MPGDCVRDSMMRIISFSRFFFSISFIPKINFIFVQTECVCGCAGGGRAKAQADTLDSRIAFNCRQAWKSAWLRVRRYVICSCFGRAHTLCWLKCELYTQWARQGCISDGIFSSLNVIVATFFFLFLPFSACDLNELETRRIGLFEATENRSAADAEISSSCFLRQLESLWEFHQRFEM